MSTPKIVAIIQARMGSTRLPGKGLVDVCGRAMLDLVVRRTARARTLTRVVVATTTESRDDLIESHLEPLGVACFRGDEDDVLARYHAAAAAFGAEVVVRITADCPLIDPGVIDEVVGAFLAARPDYASNTLRRTWPHGLDTEAFTAAALDRAFREATEPYQRAHVTPYLYQHPERFRLLPVVGPEAPDDWRWTVDTLDDLRFVRAVYEHFAGHDDFAWHEVRDLILAKPALAAINAHVRQKRLEEG